MSEASERIAGARRETGGPTRGGSAANPARAALAAARRVVGAVASHLAAKSAKAGRIENDLLDAHQVAAFDLAPVTTIEEKKVLLAEAFEDDGVLFFEHDPAMAACRLREEDGQPVFRDAVAL